MDFATDDNSVPASHPGTRFSKSLVRTARATTTTTPSTVHSAVDVDDRRVVSTGAVGCATSVVAITATPPW